MTNDVTTIKPASIEYGLEIIGSAVIGFDSFIKLCRKKDMREYLFSTIFNWRQGGPDPLWKHLCGKYKGYMPDGFNGFYLNTDDKCQKALLKHCLHFEENLDLQDPPIPNWQELRKTYFGKNEGYEENFDEDDVRDYCVMFGDKTKWEVRPHAMVWISKALLYFNNNGIDGYEFEGEIKEEFKAYKGKRFGNYPNWSKFWDQASREVRMAIVERLLTYN